MNKLFSLLLFCFLVPASLYAMETELHRASGGGDVARVEQLIAEGADVNAHDNYGYTPLHCAALHGHQEVVQLLLTHKADVNARNNDGCTPLHNAAFNGRQEVVQLLLAHGADVNTRNNGNCTPLHNAAFNGRQEVVQLLLTHGADVNACDVCGWTPLHWAASNGNQEVVQLLLTHKADVNARDNYGDTPLHKAVFKGHQEVVQLLLTHKADVNARNNNYGYTPLDWAAGHKEVVDCINNWPQLKEQFNGGLRLSWLAFATACHQRCGRQSSAQILSPFVMQHICSFLVPGTCVYDVATVKRYAELYKAHQHGQQNPAQQNNGWCIIS